MKLEFLICGSCNDAFYSQIAFFRLCLNALGGDYHLARLVAVLSDPQINSLPSEWMPHFTDIEIDWVSPDEDEDKHHNKQHYRRFELVNEDADISVICDADVAILKNFDELIDEVVSQPVIAGTIAHYPPNTQSEGFEPFNWDSLSDAVLERSIAKDYQYTLLPPESLPKTPFYINLGILISTPKLLKKFHSLEHVIRKKALPHVGGWWCAQVSLGLTCANYNLPVKQLPMRFNFPNDRIAEEMYPDEISHIVFFHYLRECDFNRHDIFRTESNFVKFLNLNLNGINKFFQDEVRRITEGFYPFKKNNPLP